LKDGAKEVGKDAPRCSQGKDGATARDLSAFFIHSIHFSFPFSTVFHLTLAGTARYFT
jgi:hypothetical protein